MKAVTHDPVELLRGVPGLGDAPQRDLEALAGLARRETFEEGVIVFSEGDPGRVLYVIESGTAELTAARGEPVFLGLVRDGDLVGELALFSGDGRRRASLTALTELRVLALDQREVEQFILSQPARRGLLEAHAESLRKADFIRQVAVFGTLDLEARRRLATLVTERRFERGELIVRQGDAGASCFMLCSGAAQVIVEDGQGERVLGTLQSGALFGEGAALTGAPRKATIRAGETCEVLELAGRDLVSVLKSDQNVAEEITYLFRLRERPRRGETVELHERLNGEGELLTTLKNPDTLTYFRLSPRGRFVWDRLDGTRSLRELTMDYFEAFASFDPHTVAEVVAALGHAQMLEDDRIASVDAASYKPHSSLTRLTAVARKTLLWRRELHRPDRLVGALYRGGGRLLFTPVGRAFIGLLVVVAAGAFVADLISGRGLDHQQGAFALVVIPSFWVALLVHEAGHALAVKAHGRQIPSAGIGWYWLTPIAYVDTSDMWLADRRARITVSLAGPIATLLIAAPVALGALVTSDPQTAAILWAVALPIYASVLVNLCPLLEYDGYYVLSDLLDRPNFRAEALRWVSRELRHSIRNGSELRSHRLEVLYAAASLLYLLLAATIIIVVYRVLLEHWLKAVLPAGTAAWLAWTVVVLNLGLAAILLVDSLRRGD